MLEDGRFKPLKTQLENYRLLRRGSYPKTVVEAKRMMTEFIAPVGNWSRRLNVEVSEGANLSSCWVRGPFTSPFSVGNSFSHLVLTATGELLLLSCFLDFVDISIIHSHYYDVI